MFQCRYHELKKVVDPRAIAEPVYPGAEAGHIAFTCLLYHPQLRLIFCGLTSPDSDILYTFDPATKEFRSLGYRQHAEKYEVKIHRSLELDSDGAIYGATACLHAVKDRLKAPGGRIFRYDPQSARYEMLGVPVKHDYIQTITLDRKRRIIYGFTYPVFKFFRFDIPAPSTGPPHGGRAGSGQARRAKDFDYIGSITHISALDDAGCLWGTYDAQLHHLFKYDPDADAITYFDHGVIPKGQGVGIMYAGAGPVDVMINAGDGFIYIGATTGELVRLDPRTAKVDYLGKPFPGKRMPCLMLGPNGLLYGAGGSDGDCWLFSYDRAQKKFDLFGVIQDESTGLKCVRVHDISQAEDGAFYIAETDTPGRSSYLWECRITA